ncbi:MAG TPA: aminoglycoside phosphotransferase family protein [Chloroflexia bacterium]|nr:aminoglycoside phosphotransferase family protein [Chloroflexia bacterium]
MLTITLPFSVEALQGALSRYLSRPTLSIEEVIPERLGGGVSGSPVYRLTVNYRYGSDSTSPSLPQPSSSDVLRLVLKRGTRHTGAILAGSARREASFYRSLAGQLPVHTPRALLTADDVTGEPTVPLVVDAPGNLAQGWDGAFDSDWVLMEALPSDVVWPQSTWTAEHYRSALTALADLHARWWGRPPSASDYPWVWTPTGQHTEDLVREARESMLEIARQPWGEKFFPGNRLQAWLDVLDNPACLLDTLTGMPQTLIHGDYWPGNIAMRADGPAVFDWQLVGVGPAPYDLACFHSSSRWWFGRLPLSLTEMRSYYLARLNEQLGYSVDRYSFDTGMDAARAWRFAVLWPTPILEHHGSLLAQLHHMRATAIEPAFASLRRCLGYIAH